MNDDADQFLIVLRPGLPLQLQTWQDGQLPAMLIREFGAGMRMIEYATYAARTAEQGTHAVNGESFEICLQGVQIIWDGTRLSVSRPLEALGQVFVARDSGYLVVGSTLAAVRAGLEPEALASDPMALLDLHFLGRILPPFTLHRGIAALDLGEDLVAHTAGSAIEARITRHAHVVDQLLQKLADSRNAGTGGQTQPELASEPPLAPRFSAVARFDLVPQCALATGLPPGDWQELEYFAWALQGTASLPHPCDWLPTAPLEPSSLALRRGKVHFAWADSLVGRSLPNGKLRRHVALWQQQRAPLWKTLLSALAQPGCQGVSLSALFDAAIVFPDRLARACRIAAACGKKWPATKDWWSAACTRLVSDSSAYQTPVPVYGNPDLVWGCNPVDRISMVTMQCRPGCVARYFPVHPLRARFYRRVMCGVRREPLSQRLTAILAAQFLEEQVLTHGN
jgi:hypothetical protein